MAEKKVVGAPDRRLVDAIKGVIERLEVTHGPLYCALLVGIEGRPLDEWALLVGSAKLTIRRLDGINAIVKAMKGLIPKDLSTYIRRVDVLRQDDPLYSYLSRAMQVHPGADVTLESCSFFGFPIERAVVFVLKKQNVRAPRRSRIAPARRILRKARA